MIVALFGTYELWIIEKAFLSYAKKFLSMIANANKLINF